MNETAFDRWLTAEPAEICLHENIECADPACECDCEHCEEFKAGYDAMYGEG